MRRVGHRRGADDEEVDVAVALQHRRAGGGPELVFRDAGPGAVGDRLHGVGAELARVADAVELLGAMHRQKLVHDPLGEDDLGLRQALLQIVVLVDRQIVLVAGVDLQQADAAAFQAELPDALRHHLAVAPVAAGPHVGDRRRRLAPHRLDMGAAHAVDERRLALAREHDIGGERVPFPMAGEPQHGAAEAPMARTARADRHIEVELAHLRAQRGEAALDIRPSRTARRSASRK